MPLPTRDVIGILGDNLRLRGSVLPIPARTVTRWARGLGLPRGGKTVLYTGQMYQLIPYIEGLVKVEQRLGDSRLAGLTGLGRRVNRLLNAAPLLVRPSRAEREAFDDVPRNVALLLRESGIEFGYLYEDDLYSGALAHDLGLDEAVAAHAHRVASVLASNGVEDVITIDPHTTNMLRSVYPTLVEGFGVRVRSYLEVLAAAELPVRAPLGESVVVHDSCVFARYEGVVAEPRALLEHAGVTVVEPEQAGRFTWCCGGPAESLYPEKAAAVAAARVEQLRAAGSEGVTMCPLCLVNLRKASDGTLRLRDVSQLLAAAVRPAGAATAE